MAQPASLDEFMEKRRSHVGKAEGGQEVVFKGFKAPPSFNPEERSAEFIMSSERIDRDGDIVRQKGIGLAEFKRNPQGLLFHQSRSWPVGTWSDVRKDLKSDPPSTFGKFNFLPAGGPVAEVDQAVWMVQHGALRTVSIGFMPLDFEMIEHGPDSGSPWSWGYDIRKSELYECSLVPVPAQPDALVKGMIAKGEMAPAREFLELALDEWARDPRTSMFVPKKDLTATYRRFFGKSAVTVMALDSVLPAEKSALRRVEEAITKAGEEHGIKQLPVPGDPTDVAPEGDAGEIEAISGVEIEFPITVNLTITQGNTGANTRVGSEVGDTGTAAADANVQGNGVNQRGIPGEQILDGTIEHDGKNVHVRGPGGQTTAVGRVVSSQSQSPPPADSRGTTEGKRTAMGSAPEETGQSLIERSRRLLKRFFGDEKPSVEEPKLAPGAYEVRKDRLSAAMARLQALD